MVCSKMTVKIFPELHLHLFLLNPSVMESHRGLRPETHLGWYPYHESGLARASPRTTSQLESCSISIP